MLPLTDSMGGKHLKVLAAQLPTSPNLTFHMFRKAGTVWAFNNGVSIQDIMSHGTWTSNGGT